MNKRPYIYLPIAFALVLMLGIVLGTLLIPAIQSRNGIFSIDLQNYDKIQQIITYVEDEYVDSTSRADLETMTINGLLQQLDPHSVYITAEDFNAANDPLQGNFDGIGVQFRIIRDSITVIGVIQGGPSEEAGLLGGDRIITIDGERAAGVKISNEDAVRKLKGPGGTKVSVEVYRKTEQKTYKKTITRGNIPTSSIEFSYMPEPGIGYIRLSRFSNNSAMEFARSANSLKAQGMTKLILDLRGNGGGVLDAAIEIADHFLPDKSLIVYTEGFHNKRKNYLATEDGDMRDLPLVILIDEFSASASEILAGALQDNDRGIIVGRRSFGKGLVQEQIPLPDGSAVRLTIARYYTATGRCIQKPYSDDFEKYYADFYRQFMTEEEIQDSLNFSDTTKFVTPEGKTVYGGGGIMPDIYVSARNEFPSDYYKKLRNRAIIFNFAFDYADQNRLTLNKYGTAGHYISNFHVGEKLIAELVKRAAKEGIPADPSGLDAARDLIKTELKAYIGREIYGDQAFFPVSLPADPVYKKGLEAVKAGK